MSELDLIKKLERLSDVKPSREWVNFTRDSILSSTPKAEKQSFFASFSFSSLAPMMACIFGALIFGSLVNLFNEKGEGAMTAKINSSENMTAGVLDVIANKEEPQVASIVQTNEEASTIAGIDNVEEEMDDLIMDEKNLAVILSENDKEAAIKEINSRLERIKNEVKECKRLEAQGLLIDETKERCNNFEDQLNTFEQILGE